MPSTPEVRLRADARRNRDQVLATAHALFALRGVEVPMEDIGRAAGVGKGTLYRHFPTRDDLYAAVSRQRFDPLRERAAELARSDDPWAALSQWLAAYDASAHAYRGLSARLAEGLEHEESAVAQACAPLCDEAEVLLERAQEHGDVADDLGIVQLLAMVSGLPDGMRDPDGRSELLPIVLRGIRAA
jgi:AcrR family transcriptional regulator